MDPEQLVEAFQNLDRRADRIEQILPTLATKDDLDALATKEELREAVARLATKEELREAVARLATKEELREAIAPLATKEEVKAAVAPLATKEEVKAEGERSRLYMKILTEEIKEKIEHFVEHVDVVDKRDARQHADTLKRHVALDKRVTALEAAGSKRRP